MPVTEHDLELEGALLAERPRLVGLCLRFTGNREMAEDLAQDTLLEAWRQLHKLHDSQGWQPWLSAIARNVCLRWARRHGQSVALLGSIECGDERQPVPLDEHPASDIALEAVLERQELALLLDRALAALPTTTREMLVAHYIDEVPQAEIAARWGVSASLVKARLHRGKQVLRRILNTDFREDAVAYGLVDSNDWQDTRVWCPYCGHHRLRGRFSTPTFMLSCPHCAVTQERGSMVAHVSGTAFADVLHGVKGYKPALSRLMTWADRYYSSGLGKRAVPCMHCGRITPLLPGLSPEMPRLRREVPAVHSRCAACGKLSAEVLPALALHCPEGQRFWREHARIRPCPERTVDRDGRTVFVTSFESITTHAVLDVVSAADTLEVLEVHRTGWS